MYSFSNYRCLNVVIVLGGLWGDCIHPEIVSSIHLCHSSETSQTHKYSIRLLCFASAIENFLTFILRSLWSLMAWFERGGSKIFIKLFIKYIMTRVAIGVTTAKWVILSSKRPIFMSKIVLNQLSVPKAPKTFYTQYYIEFFYYFLEIFSENRS